MNSPSGFTGQCLTIARALGYAASCMEDDLEELADGGHDISAAALRMEARFITVTLLSSALAECLANTVLALATAGAHAKRKARRRPTLRERWKEQIPEALGCAPFLTQELDHDLTNLCEVRNAITHSNPRLFVGDDVLDEGNTKRWELLDATITRMFVGLPLRLAAAIPTTDRFIWPMELLAGDYWMHQAIRRGSGERGRSHNMWRPPSREQRNQEQRAKGLT